MNGDAEPHPRAVLWMRYAATDLTLMQSALEDDGPPGEVCFHAQQAIEKALKAVLASVEIAIPFTHRLTVLNELLPASLRPDADALRLERLAELESQSRYPGDWQEPTHDEAEWASEMASSVVGAAQAALFRPKVQQRQQHPIRVNQATRLE